MCAQAIQRSEGSSQGAVSSSPGKAKREPSTYVKRIAADLIALSPTELTELRALCRDRLIAKPSGLKGRLPKNYNPELKAKRIDKPFPMRSSLRDMGNRISSLHPAWVFAGHGPSIIPVPMPSLTASFMAPHAAEMMQGMGSAAASQTPMASGETGAEVSTPADAGDVEPVEEEEAPKEEVTKQKATVSIKLVAFETSKKIAVVKEVRGMLGLGLKESKELVESAPKILKKNVPREEADAIVEKLKAAGADISVD